MRASSREERATGHLARTPRVGGLKDQEGDRDGEDTVTERLSSGGLGQTVFILRGFLDGLLVRHDRMLAVRMRRHGPALSGHLPLDGGDEAHDRGEGSSLTKH